ncbi:hypothetical protein KY289_025391 [Solanum tuberosum]|nr:hypothetical protein KY289_025391 [Solanum tuberosum]
MGNSPKLSSGAELQCLEGNYTVHLNYQQKATTQAFVLQDKNVDPELIVVAFRGTEFFNSDDWISDFNLSWYDIPGMGKVHAGFVQALGLQKSLGWPKNIVQTDDNINHPPPAYYFLRKLLKQLLEKNEKARVVYSNDMVPRMPYDNSTFMFKHFGTCIYYNSLYREKILVEEPDKNGSFLLLFIPKMLNAAWELMRSCILPCVHGRKYQEGGLLLFMRVVGLLLPGMPAHCPQDYVNSTRLGSSDHSTEDVAKYQKIGIVPA